MIYGPLALKVLIQPMQNLVHAYLGCIEVYIEAVNEKAFSISHATYSLYGNRNCHRKFVDASFNSTKLHTHPH